MESIDDFFGQQKQEGRPFCLFVCLNSPHSPWDQGDASAYDPNTIKLPPYIVDTPLVRKVFCDYLAEITYFDGQVGNIIKLLDAHQLSDNTFVMVLSEQGNSFPFAKWTCYDHGLQSAMVVRWPKQVKAGIKTSAMVEYVDITPTLIDVAGGESVEGLDGTSFLPVLRNQTDHHKDFVFGIMTTRGIIHGSEAYAIRSIRSEHYKLILNLNYDDEFRNVMMQSGFYKTILAKAESGDEIARRLVEKYSQRPAVELYDLENDPLEMTNIADSAGYEQIVSDLSRRLREWMVSQQDLGVPTEKTAHLRQPKRTKENRRYTAAEIGEQARFPGS